MENLHLPSVCSLLMVSMHSYEHVLSCAIQSCFVECCRIDLIMMV